MKITEREFRNEEPLRNELRGILESPTMLKALSVLEEKAKVRGSPEPRPNAHLDTLTTQRYCKLQGVQFALDTLYRLLEPNPISPEDEDQADDFDQQPFFSTLPEAVKDALRKQRQQNP